MVSSFHVFGPKFCRAHINFPMLAARFVHVILLNFIIQIIFDEEEKL